jgi:hypothetical protein
MDKLSEIEAATEALFAAEKQELLVFLATRLRRERQSVPQQREAVPSLGRLLMSAPLGEEDVPARSSAGLDRAALKNAASKMDEFLEHQGFTEPELEEIGQAFKAWRKNRKSVEE